MQRWIALAGACLVVLVTGSDVQAGQFGFMRWLGAGYGPGIHSTTRHGMGGGHGHCSHCPYCATPNRATGNVARRPLPAIRTAQRPSTVQTVAGESNSVAQPALAQ